MRTTLHLLITLHDGTLHEHAAFTADHIKNTLEQNPSYHVLSPNEGFTISVEEVKDLTKIAECLLTLNATGFYPDSIEAVDFNDAAITLAEHVLSLARRKETFKKNWRRGTNH